MKAKIFELKRQDPLGLTGVLQRAAKCRNFHVAYGATRNLAKVKEAMDPIDALWRSRPISTYLEHRVIDQEKGAATPSEEIKAAPEGSTEEEKAKLDCPETWKAGENAFMASLDEDVEFTGYRFDLEKLPEEIGSDADPTLTEDFARVVARFDLLKG